MTDSTHVGALTALMLSELRTALISTGIFSCRITPGDRRTGPDQWQYEIIASRYPGDHAVALSAKIPMPLADLSEVAGHLRMRGYSNESHPFTASARKRCGFPESAAHRGQRLAIVVPAARLPTDAALSLSGAGLDQGACPAGEHRPGESG